MSLFVAIFLVVVVASLSAFAVTVGTSKDGTVNQQAMADRAAAAAHAGAEWGAYRARIANSCLAVNPPINFGQGALRGFRVTVTCTSTSYSEPAPGGNYYVRDIDAFAQYGNFGASNYASARATARVSNAP
jgi:MSHA biogenesis protein MshP